LKESNSLRILNLEDDPLDTELIQASLLESGIACEVCRVQTRTDFAAALEKGCFDLILADYTLPSFDGLLALEMAQEICPEVPFILVSGTLGEEVAVESIKNGATDYVLKHRLERLVPAVRRAVREAEERSEHRSAEEALRESEKRFRALVQNASDIVMILDVDSTVRYESPAVERVLGFRPKERIGTSIFDYVHPDDLSLMKSRFADLLKNLEDRVSAEYRTRDKEGSWHHFEAIVSNLLHDPAIQGIVVNSRDNTDRKRTEEALRESEERFRATFDQAAVGVAQVAPDGRWLRVNQKFCDIVGYEEEELRELTFQDITHLDDLEADREQVRRLLSGEIETYSMEKRYLRKDGSSVWINLTTSLVRASSDEPTHLIAVVEDISKRKRAEDRLRQSEELYRTVVELAAENIFLVDAKTKRILETNDYFHRSLGYRAEELNSMTLYDIVAHDRESIDRYTQRILEEGRFIIGERHYRRKDGSLVNVEVNASTIPRNDRVAMCITAHDITERKRAEGMLRRSLDALLALYEAGHVLGSTLESEEVGTRLLRIMQRVSSLSTAVISRPDEHGRLRVWRAVGLEGLPKKIRYTPVIQNALRIVLETGEHRVFRLQHQEQDAEPFVGLGLPLRMQNRSIGLLEAYGPENLLEEDTLDILGSMSSQAASALENARLYGELAEREKRLEDFVGKLMTAQEEERRRVAYEVHDGLAQVAVAAHQHLQAFSRRHPPDNERGWGDLQRVLRLVRQTVSDARKIIAYLRPTALDDLGLAAAVSLEVERLREDGYRVDYQEELGEERLPDTVEIALFRVTQEALTNVRKHAQTGLVSVELWRRGEEVRLEIRDYGRGFDPAAVSTGSGPGERVGLAGMRERVSMLGGNLTIHSKPGAGTSVTVTVPLLVTIEEG
jgi:PAS domain S-box-containing protein